MTRTIHLFFTVLSLFLVSFFMSASAADAAGWWKESGSDTANLSVSNGVTGSAEILWSSATGNAGYTSPHGGFTTTSNLCKTCHAIHGAGQQSFRLIKNGNTTEGRTSGEDFGVNGMGSSRANECMYCHDANSGASSKRPYELGALGAVVRGEHTLGANAIPDSSVNSGGLGWGNLPDRGGPYAEGRQILICYSCHTVHGANNIGHDNDNDGVLDPLANGATYDANDAVERWNSKILRVDPAGDGSVLATGLQGTLSAAQWTAELGTSTADGGALAVRTGFCVDCHNKNPNWSLTTDDADRPNKTSHPQGPGADSMVEAYGESVQVAAHPLEKQGCRGCHFATDNDSRPGPSRFPHQTTGYKLLYDEATQDQLVSDTGSPFRDVPRLDRICLSCHRVGQEPMGGYEEEEESACLECHDSKYGAPDIGDELRKFSAMPILSILGKHREGGRETAVDFSGSNRHVECVDCHRAESVYPWSDQPLTGIWGITVDSESVGQTPDLEVVSGVTEEWQLCFKCHASGPGWGVSLPDSLYYTDATGDPVKTENKAIAFNSNNSAFHPVRRAGRNQSEAIRQSLAGAGLDPNSTIKCTDCHNSNSASDQRGRASNSSFRPKGPHGSTNAPILRGNYYMTLDPLPTGFDSDNFELCFLCHDVNLLTNETGWVTNFSDQAGVFTVNLHWAHLKDLQYRAYSGVATCRRCHYNIHSNQQAQNTIYAVWPDNGTTWEVSATPPQGYATRLVNFAPRDYVKARQTSGAPVTQKPLWMVNLDDVAHTWGTATVQPRQRRCALECHMGSGEWQVMGRLYAPTSSYDTDSMAW